MLFIFIAIGALLNHYKESINNIDYYSVQIEVPSIDYKLKPKESDSELEYKPNVHSFSAMSIGNSYGSLTITSQNNDEDKEDLGATKVFDVQFIGYRDTYLWEAYYQNYQGLYITDSTLENDLPTANSWSYGLSIKQFFSDDFNLKKSLRNFTAQKETNWSWIRGLYINKNKLFTSDGLIPSEFENKFYQLIGLSGIETTNLGLDFGIGGTYSYQGYFATSMLTLGYQLQEQIYDGISDKKRTVTQHGSTILIGLGHDFNINHSLGLELRGSNINIPLKNVEYTQSRSITSIYYKYFF